MAEKDNVVQLKDRTGSGSGIGAVMVVGGGIAGMQASLDLANSGFKVYLIEKDTAIGGRMSQLDKTFPTNDCAMCVISPKLVEVDKDLNIDIITNSEVMAIEGSVGNFEVTVREHARYVDLDKCTSCGDCFKVCPVSVPNDYNYNLNEKNAIYKRYPQGIPNAYAISKGDRAPCGLTCPTGINVQGYVALVGDGKFQEAYDLITERNPFPSVCGRVCHHPCEGECNRGEIDEPVAINNLKRFVSDWVRNKKSEEGFEAEKPAMDPGKPKIAIVGGGPSGLTAAKDLVLDGYPVTVFEAEEKLGGEMRYGIPRYRLPEEMLDWDIKNIIDLGIEVKTKTALGKDFTIKSLRDDGYKSIYIGTGLPMARRVDFKGADLEGVLWGIEFLNDVAKGKKVELGKKVVVIGGGNVAIDVAMTAIREGGSDIEVEIVSLECREEMPAHEWEIQDAVDEGIKLNPSWGPEEILGDNGKVKGIKLTQCTCVFDENGKFDPRFDKTCESTLDADNIIIAIGQAGALDWIGDDSPVEKRGGGLVSDPLTLATNLEGVFSGGDVAYGPKSVVEAINQGHEAAESMKRYTEGKDLAEGREKPEQPKAKVPEDRPHYSRERYEAEKTPVEERRGNYKEVELTFTEEMAVDEAKRCVACGICCECFQCVIACLPEAVNHNQETVDVKYKVGSLVLAPGFDLFDAYKKPEYGYGRYPNVITSMEMERTFSASGPYQGHVKRPSDKTLPARIAWLQCVGSRDASIGQEYCSSVCCTYATKQATLAKDHYREKVTATIFLNDLRTFGKGFERYYNNAVEKYGVRYVKSFISTIKEDPSTKNLLISFIDEEGKLTEEEFDLVVLSMGLVPSKASQELAERVDIKLNKFGFVEPQPMKPGETSRDGIFVAGAFEAPKDIPESVMSASSAAALSTELLSKSRGTMVTSKEYPPEKKITPEDEPRIGVFVCHCGVNIAGVVDVPDVVEYAKTIPNVVHVENNLFTCSTDTQEQIKKIVEENDLNRVVVASCSPRTHEPLFQDTIRDAGLNKYLFEMANIRDQCSWVHVTEPGHATDKAKDLVRMAISRSRTLESLYELPFKVKQNALIIGGGVSGMVAAVGLAKQGFQSDLVEISDTLGGNAHHVHYTLEGVEPGAYVEDLIREVNSNDLINLHLNTTVKKYSGHVGKFTTVLESNGSMSEIEHGAYIVATGGVEYQPSEYMYGENENVITQVELEEKIVKSPDTFKNAKNLVMIQCVGSRDKENPYCSRYCCSAAVKNALKLREINPELNIYVLYRDIRTYAFKELYYKEAREKGINFITYDKDIKPEISSGKESALTAVIYDKGLDADLEIDADYLVLSAAIRPHPESHRIVEALKLSNDPDNFFLEAHMKLRPLDFANIGVFLCGLAHSPKLIEESISQAKGAVSRACSVLSREEMMVGGIVSHVEADQCVACLTCVRVCPYDVPVINAEGVAEISEASCQGCGNCAAACPRKAIELYHYKDKQIISKCEVLFA